MKQLTLVFPGEPKAIQSVRSVSMGKFIRHYQPKQNEDWKSYVRVSAQSQLSIGWKPMTGPVAIGHVLFAFPMTSSLKKAERNAVDAGLKVWKVSKPDMMDNLFKGLLDALSGVVYLDDKQICHLEGPVDKVYAEIPRIEIELWEMGHNIELIC